MCAGAIAGTHDNVVVPPGATCTMTGATVRGNLIVLTQGAVWATNSNVHGNIEATKPRYVWLDGNTVGGRVWVKETGPAPDALPVWFCRNNVAGNIQVEKLTAAFGGAWPEACPHEHRGREPAVLREHTALRRCGKRRADS